MGNLTHKILAFINSPKDDFPSIIYEKGSAIIAPGIAAVFNKKLPIDFQKPLDSASSRFLLSYSALYSALSLAISLSLAICSALTLASSFSLAICSALSLAISFSLAYLSAFSLLVINSLIFFTSSLSTYFSSVVSKVFLSLAQFKISLIVCLVFAFMLSLGLESILNVLIS